MQQPLTCAGFSNPNSVLLDCSVFSESSKSLSFSSSLESLTSSPITFRSLGTSFLSFSLLFLVLNFLPILALKSSLTSPSLASVSLITASWNILNYNNKKIK